jgi:FkbM family methyltransferase
MKLYQSILNSPAKFIAKPISTVLTSKPLFTPARYFESYFSYLLGKGAAGSSIQEEVKGALSMVRRKSPIIFDIGANIGDWSKALLELEPNAKLFQFEPSEACRNHIQKLGLSRTLLPFAIGSHRGEVEFYHGSAIDPVDCSASLYRRRDSRWGEYEYQVTSVQMNTIDNIISDYSLDFVDFIKMDIEGNEYEALKGAASSLRAQKIGSISFEFGASNINSRTFFHDFWDLFNEYDYNIYRVTPGNSLVQIREYYEDLEYFRGASNYIAFLKNHPFS